MNWIDNFVPPKIKSIFSRRDTPDNLWIKCPESGQMVFHKDLEANHFVVPGSGHHMRMTAKQRLASFLDSDSFEPKDLPDSLLDPLKFRDEKRYVDRLKEARAKTGMQDAVLYGLGKLEGLTLAAAVQDFAFMGGSLGVTAGGGIVATFELAIEHQCPAVIFTASGGARMQEGVLSLMQLPRTTAARQALRKAGLPYIVVLTHPTTGGVTASYAMLGDIHIAEPGALIGFAGPRVIEQTIREKLPLGFQRSEFLHKHGMVDMVVHRHELRQTIARLLRTLTHAEVQSKPASSTNEPLALVDQKAHNHEAGSQMAQEPSEPKEST